ncbi:HTH domain-containing protein [Rubrobacter aplysinae]|uniref:HTH domain-containing protein n=1 Tax=Rubrobacter aplysinae TaxID=909625 RepID=UPI0009FC6B86|nr:HTH domain-containing protein [Rubrobacter aplysinae]
MSESTWKDAIVDVLKEEESAMHFTEIAEKIVESGLRKNMGATPANTVNAVITTDITSNGEDSKFARVRRGEYMLREQQKEDVSKIEAEISSIEVDQDSDVQAETGIIQAFGLYWRRDFVQWSNTPSLLGQQNRRSQTVDFAEQKGVYLLHDGRSTIYVGRSVDRTIGRRLYEHNYDRLGGRWDRFSWFGLLEVTEDAQLRELSLAVDQDVVIVTLEALLIETLEPPQNRKRGDEFRAIEYLQAKDPSLEKQQVLSLLDDVRDKLTERY